MFELNPKDTYNGVNNFFTEAIMAKAFQRILLYGRQRSGSAGFRDTLNALIEFLEKHGMDIMLEQETTKYLPDCTLESIDFADIGGRCDLIIVVGGDGSMLQAAHIATKNQIPLLGINRGRLGFLTDVAPAELEEKLSSILQGEYATETRFLLHSEVMGNTNNNHTRDALNDVVLLPGDVAHMIEFEIFIDNKPVCSQRADGLIIATPTGSTAYALSGGGPILHPKLDAIVLVPMFPHTLSSRPIVVDANSEIKIIIDKNTEAPPGVSCDGQERVIINPGQAFHIRKNPKLLTLIHPLDYNYYQTLRVKLRWESKH